METSTQTGTPVQFRELNIDMEKALKAPHAAFAFRLMLLLNDLLSLRYLGSLIGDDRRQRPELGEFQTGTGSHLVRLQQAHVAEAMDSFLDEIDRSREDKVSSLRAYIDKAPKVAALNNRLKELKEDKQMGTLIRLRNTIVFHHNDKNDGEEVMRSAQNHVKGALRLHGSGPVAGIIMEDPEREYFRLLVGDKIAAAAWTRCLGVDTKDGAGVDGDLMESSKRFVVSAASVLIGFADQFILHWITDNELQLR